MNNSITPANKLVGLSLSFCIKDIAKGKVKIEDVEKIYTSASSWQNTPEFLMKIYESYRGVYWRGCDITAYRVMKKLADEGRIVYGGVTNLVDLDKWQPSENFNIKDCLHPDFL